MWKVFNKNNVTASYSCGKNMKKIIDTHNRKLLNNIEGEQNNCRIKSACSMEGNCFVENRVYLTKTRLENKNNVNEEHLYIGANGNEWKKDTTIAS